MTDKDFFSGYFELSDDSPSGLRWKVAPAQCVQIGGAVGAPDGEGYWRVQLGGTALRVHRIIAVLTDKLPTYDSPLYIDHINGDVADNTPCNLRAVTPRENLQNKRRHREGKLPGATYDKATGRWRARIMVGGKDKRLGTFETEEAAHAAYMQAVTVPVEGDV